jgi:FMN phosphatase YigB (HAD superfamily)
MEAQLTQTSVKALAFDTGGTVLDWHRGIRTALAEREHGTVSNEIGQGLPTHIAAVRFSV